METAPIVPMPPEDSQEPSGAPFVPELAVGAPGIPLEPPASNQEANEGDSWTGGWSPVGKSPKQVKKRRQYERAKRQKRERQARELGAPRKGGRPPKSAPSRQEPGPTPEGKRWTTEREDGLEAELGTVGPDPETVAHLAGALGVTFLLLSQAVAKRRGEFWTLSGEESDQLGQAWAVVAAPYLEAHGAAVPLVAACTVTAGVLAPRVVEEMTRAARPELSGEVVPNPSPPPAPAPVKDAEDRPAPKPSKALTLADTRPGAEPVKAGGGPILPPRDLA